MALDDVDSLMRDLDNVLIDDQDPHRAFDLGGGGVGGEGAPDSFDASQLQAPNANDFSNARLIEELETRKMRPTGFRDQDVITLQRVLDEEFELEKENLIKQQREKKEQAAKQAGLQRKRMMLERQLKEEKAEIEKDHRVEFWLSLVKQNATPPAARIEVNSITARALAKSMWTNSSLTCLDLSRTGLDDFAGAYVARLLKRNSTLIKMDLEANHLGPKACWAFGESLRSNTTLTSLSLESNQLTRIRQGEDTSGFTAFAAMLEANKTLTSVNLWRCALGPQAGAALAKGMESNHYLTFLETGHNGLTLMDQQSLTAKLEDNVRRFEEQAALKREEQAAADKVVLEQKTIQEQLRKERALREWLEEQKQLRAEERRQEQEKRYTLVKEKEAEATRLLAEKREEEKKAKEAADAKKKKKNKKK